MMVYEVTQRHVAALKKSQLAARSKAAMWNRDISVLRSLLGLCPVSLSRHARPADHVESRAQKAANLKAMEPKGKLGWLNEGDERKLLDRLWALHLSRSGERAPLDRHAC